MGHGDSSLLISKNFIAVVSGCLNGVGEIKTICSSGFNCPDFVEVATLYSLRARGLARVFGAIYLIMIVSFRGTFIPSESVKGYSKTVVISG